METVESLEYTFAHCPECSIKLMKIQYGSVQIKCPKCHKIIQITKDEKGSNFVINPDNK